MGMHEASVAMWWEEEAWYRAAWQLVLQRHRGHVDRLGRPAEEHFTRVARRLGSMFPNATRAQVEAALLHDALEPGGFTLEQLVSSGLLPETLRILRNIQLPVDGRSYLQYIHDLVATGDVEAIQVKLADNADAFDVYSAIGGVEGETRLNEQYIPSRDILRRGLA